MIKNANLVRGFTLIELLVVIAIIGILSSVVLSSLNVARGKSTIASVKSNLANSRVQADLFYSSNSNTYSGGSVPANVCGSTVASDGVTKSIRGFAQAAKDILGSNYTVSFVGATQPSPTNVACQAIVDKWAIQAPLPTGGYWCVDYRGTASYSATAMGGNVAQCP